MKNLIWLAMIAVLIGLLSQLARANNSISLESVATDGTQGNGFSIGQAISSDGQRIVFASDADNLVEEDVNGWGDIFLRDVAAGTTVIIAENANHLSSAPAISADGTTVAFQSLADNLVPNDTNGQYDIFVRSLPDGPIERVSVTSAGEQAFQSSFGPALSADGRIVAFSTTSSLVPTDTNRFSDVYVHDRVISETVRVSVATDGTEGNEGSSSLDISDDGRFIAFTSRASNLAPNDMPLCFGLSCDDVFLHDRNDGTTKRISVNSSGDGGNGHSRYPHISADGRFVVFQSYADNLVSNDVEMCFEENCTDIFIYDRNTDSLSRVVSTVNGVVHSGHATAPDISADGNTIAYQFLADEQHEPCRGLECILVYDRTSGAATVVTQAFDGGTPNGSSFTPVLSADGRFVAFSSVSSTLVENDNNGQYDVFLHERTGQPHPNLPIYYGVRDQLMRGTLRGDRYIGLYEAHSQEMVNLILADGALRADALHTLSLWAPSFQALLDGERAQQTVISAEQVQTLDDFLTAVENAGSEALTDAISAERAALPPLTDFVGMSMIDARDLLLPPPAYTVYLPITRSTTSASRATPTRNTCFVECAHTGQCQQDP